MTASDVAQVRAFNRYYTRVLGLLDKGILNSEFSLPEARVLYELHQLQPCSAKELILVLDMDKGYLSRILKSFARKQIIKIELAKTDARVSEISLTAKGNTEFEKINKASSEQIRQMLAKYSDAKVKLIVGHMHAIKQILTDTNL